ncbi:MAG: ABC transporter ATP-binding protein [Muribaculaceae bacterium]|nr:ABC transporter ATP-binding protein [Muribaculaceae bacterium]
MSHPSNILSTSRLAVGYRNGNNTTNVLSNLDLSLRKGELVCLLGANGAGKSTLLRTLSGVQQPLEGSVHIDGKGLNSYSKKQISRLISIVYTDRTLAGALTVYELVSLGRHPYTGFLGRLDDEDHRIVSESIIAMGISHKAQDYVANLSDGERQKAMIARALAQEAPIIILDEPTAFLDVASRVETMQQLQSLAQEKNKAILLSSHDINQSLALASRLWLLRNDHTIIEGVTEDLVLAGKIDSLFENRQVTFNPLIGDFMANHNTIAAANLQCDDPILRQWITNALQRNGIGIAANPKDAFIAIKANTPSSIMVNNTEHTSIESMLTIIHPLLK